MAVKREKVHFASIDELLGAPALTGEGTEEIKLEDIHSFKNHPFKVVDDEKMEDLVTSITVNGILTLVLLRPDGKYGDAIRARESIWPSEDEESKDDENAESTLENYYDKEYEDLEDYYYYARGMKTYGSANSLSLMLDALDEFDHVSAGFKDKNDICDEIYGYENQLLGTFTRTYQTYGDYAEHRYYVDVTRNYIEFGFGSYKKERGVWKEEYTFFNREESFPIVNGKISSIILDNKLAKIEIIPEKGGMRVKDYTDYSTDNHWDFKETPGFYTRFEY